MSCTSSIAFLHLHCIHIARMHLFSKPACYLPLAGVGRQQCQRPTLATTIASVQRLQLAEARFQNANLISFTVFCILSLLFVQQPPCMLPDPCFGFAPRFCIVFRTFTLFSEPLHCFLRLCIVFCTRTVFCACFGSPLACRLHCLVFPAVLFYRLHLH